MPDLKLISSSGLLEDLHTIIIRHVYVLGFRKSVNGLK